MPIKIFHTGDVHIGMKFNNYPNEVRDSLYEARYTVLENMINKANDMAADIFVIAGDLFNAIQIPKKYISKTVDILNRFGGSCLLVLPGNHDYDNGAIDLWKDFSETQKGHILLINEERPYDLKDYDLDVVIYPAPCHSKHSKENSLGWIKDQGLVEGRRYHIGIGHGALEGLSPDMEGNYYYMTLDELYSIPMDLWLVGHTHVSYPPGEKVDNHKIYNAGTPEPDGLNYADEGYAWFIELSEDKTRARKLCTGQYRFYDKAFTVNLQEDLEEIWVWALKDNPHKKIIRLNLSGNIPKEVYENIHEYYKKLEAEVFFLIIEDSKLKIRITEEIIAREFPAGSFPYEFLKSLSHDEEALQIAYDLLGRKENAN